MPFEYHIEKLIKLIDNYIEPFWKRCEFQRVSSGWTYSAAWGLSGDKASKQRKNRKYVREGKFAVGLWYVLQDEFLTSSEANIRNLLVGMSIARDFGKIMKLWLTDTKCRAYCCNFLENDLELLSVKDGEIV